MKETALELFRKASSLFNQGKLNDAIEKWEEVSYYEDPILYAKAQVNLGITYNQQGEVDKAMEAYQRVPFEIKEQYAHAQVNLGIMHQESGDIESAVIIFNDVAKTENEQYEKAQFSLGVIHYFNDDYSFAIECYKRITKDSSNLYPMAMLNLIGAYVLSDDMVSTEKNLKNIEVLANELGGEYKYRFDVLNSILNSEFDHCTKLSLCKIDEYVHSILSCLTLDDAIESKLAHYTSPSTGFILLSEEEQSKFRLNTIKGMNDPTEGMVLEKYLNLKYTEDSEFLTFISCFTFNHDSLNQFRLYGKEMGEEASGISLVFDYDKFFVSDARQKYLGIIQYNQRTEKQSDTHTNNEYVKKLPLYRCIYLESYNDGSFYISIAQRDEITFYRENKFGNKTKKFNKYKVQMEYNRRTVENCLIKIKNCISKLDLNDHLNYFLNKVLLPLKYLVKHSAFKEEQECRVIYISSLDNNKIHVENKVGNEKMYVEYEQSIKDAIHKIYLSPGAERYKDYFRRLLKDSKGEKVFSSRNPFRVKK